MLKIGYLWIGWYKERYFNFYLPFECGLALKETDLLLQEQILSFTGKSLSKRVSWPREVNRKSKTTVVSL